MTGTYAVIGHPINVAGISLKPPFLSASSGVWAQTTADLIPVSSLVGGAAEASALIGCGNASMIG